MTQGDTPGDRLLLALRARRGEGVPLSAAEAFETIAGDVPRLVRGYLRRYCQARGIALDEELEEAAASHAEEICWQGRFRGESVGEAVAFVHTCGHHRFVDGLKQRMRQRRWQELARADETSSPGHDSEVAHRLRALRRVLARISLMVPAPRRPRIQAFLDSRLGCGKPVPAIRDDESKKVADRIYQARSAGKKYLMEELPRLTASLSPEELDLLKKLLEAPDLSEDLLAVRPEGEDAP
jgi:DNA-directed RNA polymerase specialized sigma24 family protein